MRKFCLLLVCIVCVLGNVVAQKKINLIPYPQEIDIQEGSLYLDPPVSIVCKGGKKEMGVVPAEVEALLKEFRINADYAGSVKKGVKSVVLILDENEDIAAGGYVFDVDFKKATITASTGEGLKNGVETLRQLINGKTVAKIPAVKIKDNPRFNYRGFMLDCSRHFWTIDELKRVVDQLAILKMNHLHLHLTDNEGWRLEIKKYPKLTTVGTTYKDFPEMSGNFYSQKQMKELIAYAQKRFITIVPEIDLPGHCRAALAAYPELSCKGGEFEVYPQEQDRSTIKRGSEVMLCPGKTATQEFVKEVLKEVCQLFPGKYIHLGGDEVEKHIWKECPDCQKMIKDNNLKDEHELQDHFTKQVSAIVESYGKRMLGWDEINDRGAAGANDVVMVWRDKGIHGRDMALKANRDMIMCPQHGCYYDWGYTGNSTKKVYNWEPVPEGLTAEQESLFLGGQACLWTEKVVTTKDIDERIFPRIMALSEVLWLKSDNHNWDRFLENLNAYYPTLEKMGVQYFVEEDMDAKEFKPDEDKPVLVRNAKITTNIGTFNPYVAEFTFDGRKNSYFWSCQTVDKGNWFKLTLGEPASADEIEVITGDSKDYLNHGDLEVSYDGENFVKIGTFKDGIAKGKLSGEKIKAINIKVTGPHTGWVIIREIIIK
ncbi:beta-hexosaminidase [Puteibacter caeruleilacunae]|nr:beta-hexosaminidase [Puteibacter caeruleilacunae]